MSEGKAPRNHTVCPECNRTFMRAIYMHNIIGVKISNKTGKEIKRLSWLTIGKVCRQCGAIRIKPEYTNAKGGCTNKSRVNCTKCGGNSIQAIYMDERNPKVDKDGHPVMKTNMWGHTTQASKLDKVRAGAICKNCGHWAPSPNLILNQERKI